MTAVIVCSVVVLAIASLVALNQVFRRLRRRAADQVARAGPGVVRVADANCFGIRSKGKWQNRGNGTLILTAEHLVFEPLVGSNRVDQPLESITTVDTVRSFLGKSVFRDLLHVEWRTETGVDDAAWLVADLEGWLAALKS